MATDSFKAVQLNLDTDKLATEWAKYTVLHLQEYIEEHMSAAATRELMKSIRNELSRNGGNIDKVVLKFLQYGRFWDMGVGRGVPIGGAGSGAFSAARNDNGTLKKYRRKPVKWFSKTYYREVQSFKELYAKMFNKEIPIQISAALTVEVKLAA
jgi:hypothetical protein